MIAGWLSIFYESEPSEPKTAFDIAAFIANQAWMDGGESEGHKTLDISFDMGSPWRTLLTIYRWPWEKD
jgi:hypothetical protein